MTVSRKLLSLTEIASMGDYHLFLAFQACHNARAELPPDASCYLGPDGQKIVVDGYCENKVRFVMKLASCPGHVDLAFFH